MDTNLKTNGAQDLAQLLGQLNAVGVQTFNPETNKGFKILTKNGSNYELTDEQKKSNEQFITEYREGGVITDISDSILYNKENQTSKQKVVITFTNKKGDKQDFEATYTLVNYLGETRKPLVIGQTVTMLVQKQKEEFVKEGERRKIYYQAIEGRKIVDVDTYESFFDE